MVSLLRRVLARNTYNVMVDAQELVYVEMGYAGKLYPNRINGTILRSELVDFVEVKRFQTYVFSYGTIVPNNYLFRFLYHQQTSA